MSKARCQVRAWFTKTIEVEGNDTQAIQAQIKRSINADPKQIYSWENMSLDVVTVEVVQLDKETK